PCATTPLKTCGNDGVLFFSPSKELLCFHPQFLLKIL
ncbi:MAG: hypothetical protein ACI909_002262, partial [Planctomycetota bacterium]